MNCLKCELMRARLAASFAVLYGSSLEEVAAFLTERYGARYFVDRGKLFREAKPHNKIIYEVSGDEF